MSGVSCADARNLFEAHLNGELSAALETELNAHRLRCPVCRHQLAIMEVAGEVIAADDAIPPLSDEFTSRLLACVAEQRTSRYFARRRMLRIGASGLAAAAVLALAVLVFSRPGTQVAGYWKVGPGASARSEGSGPTERRAESQPADSAQESFQVRLERALTEWRHDASSLRKVYRFITPQIEELQRERPENVNGQPDLFQPGRGDALPSDAATPATSIEDI